MGQTRLAERADGAVARALADGAPAVLELAHGAGDICGDLFPCPRLRVYYGAWSLLRYNVLSIIQLIHCALHKHLYQGGAI